MYGPSVAADKANPPRTTESLSGGSQPRDVPLSISRMPELSRTISLIEHGLAEGLHVGAQLYVSLAGEPVADVALGFASGGVPMTTDTLMLWLSAGKPLLAVAVAQLWERALLRMDDPVARFVPEFAANGKGSVTIRHLLNHTAGFRGVATTWSTADWDTLIARICNAPLEPGWTPGRKAGYHVASSWMILGEVVRRITGRPLQEHLREALLLPLGMDDAWLSMPAERHAEYGPRIGVMHDTTKFPPTPQEWDAPEHAALLRPGGNIRGPVRQLGAFYESCLAAFDPRLNRPTVLRPQTMDCLVARHRANLPDHTFKHVIDWGLGFIINSSQYGVETLPYSFGRHASARTFGHGGAQSSTGFADPEHGLVVAVVFNGMPGEAAHNNRVREVASATYEDLGLISHFPPP